MHTTIDWQRLLRLIGAAGFPGVSRTGIPVQESVGGTALFADLRHLTPPPGFTVGAWRASQAVVAGQFSCIELVASRDTYLRWITTVQFPTLWAIRNTRALATALAGPKAWIGSPLNQVAQGALVAAPLGANDFRVSVNAGTIFSTQGNPLMFLPRSNVLLIQHPTAATALDASLAWSEIV